MKAKSYLWLLFFCGMLMGGIVQAQIGERPESVVARAESLESLTDSSIAPQVTETGFISLSVDGLGAYPENTGIIQVEKPAGATVRGAYFMAATTGFRNHRLSAGDITIDGVPISWDIEIPNSIESYNYWADVTSIVSSKIDTAPAGRVDFTITEANTAATDGEVLAVIFDDPSQMTSNTIVLLFGAQNIAGDTFNIGLAEPLDKDDPDLVLDMSLGISFGYQPTGQVSHVDVNGERLTSSAGGQDDGYGADGGLLTVGGLDDSNANPDPYAPATSIRTDDELYDLLPFVETGDTAITVDTINPSRDDNIFFASLFLASTTAVVGEGIVLAPVSATNEVGTSHTVTATVQDDDGNLIVGRDVTFTIVSGPHAGQTFTTPTNSSGQAEFTYTGTLDGLDVIEASFVDSQGDTIISNEVTKEWVAPPLISVDLDIKPTGCPNPFNVTAKGVLPVAILGTESFDVAQIDVASLRLASVAPIRSSIEDVASPIAEPNDCDCTTEGPDGYLDLTLKFYLQELVDVIGDVEHDDVLSLAIEGATVDGTPIEGQDCIVIRGRHLGLGKADTNDDGLVNFLDLLSVSEKWLHKEVLDKE